ncbi:MAG TPA: accessory gene regulator B family protein [Epulopiscium sp.]|nr:accessory gene regulator B family protein [Candidatus Epulonipiscium sp.]
MIGIEKLTKQLVDCNIIEDEDKELYSFGFKQMIILIYSFITIIAIGFVFNMTWESIIFILAYGVLRPYAGGYHAKTQLRCYLFSVFMMVAVLWLIKHILWNNFICFIIMTIASIIIFVLAPVEDGNKPLDDVEQTVYKKRTNIILSILIGLTVLFWVISLKQISICISVSLGTLSIMLMLGKIKNLIKRKI